MSEKHKIAAAYSSDLTRDCETVLVVLLRAFAGFKGNLRLVGGLVPRYLTPAAPPEVPVHVGTTDVDVVLDVSVLIDSGDYASLKRQLENAGFTRFYPRPDAASSWQWVYMLDGRSVVVEFLQHTDDPAKSSKLASIDGEHVSACQILHVGIARDWFEEKAVSVELPGQGGHTEETIRYADAVSFIVLKAVAFDQRHEPKDVADLIHVMMYWRDLDQLADCFVERLQSGQHSAALDAALQALARRFCDGGGVEGYRKDGPAGFVNFHGLGADDPDARTRELRQVSGTVTYLLTEIQEKAGRRYLPS